MFGEDNGSGMFWNVLFFIIIFVAAGGLVWIGNVINKFDNNLSPKSKKVFLYSWRIGSILICAWLLLKFT